MTAISGFSRTSAIVQGVPSTAGGTAAVLSEEQADLKIHVAALMALRDAHPALANGSRTHIYSDSNVYVDRKDKGSDNVLYVLNAKGTPAVVTLASVAIGSAGALVDLSGGTDVALAGGNYEIALKPFEARFFDIVSPTSEQAQAFLDDIVDAARRFGYKPEESPGQGDPRIRGLRQ